MAKKEVAVACALGHSDVHVTRMLAYSIISLCLIHLKPREYTYEMSVLL